MSLPPILSSCLLKRRTRQSDCSVRWRVRILARQRPHIHEILRNLTSAMIYSMADSIVAKIPPVLSREENIAQQYINNVSQNYHRRRKVIDYASEMNITPGYLSSVVKNVTGKSAAEWIEEYVLMEAKALLASTDMTIQQICYQLNFPTQSFFGKYFKTHTGVSPKAYRAHQQKPVFSQNLTRPKQEEFLSVTP